MKMKSLSFLLSMVLFFVASTLACNVPTDQFEEDCFVYGVNSYVHGDGSTITNGGSVSLPATVWIKVAPNTAGTGFAYTLATATLQYKYRVPGGDYTDWVTIKTLDHPAWKIDFARGPVPLFGKNCLDIADIPADTEILLRVYLSTGVFQNADTGDDSDETGQNGWGTKYIMKIVYNGDRRVK